MSTVSGHSPESHARKLDQHGGAAAGLNPHGRDAGEHGDPIGPGAGGIDDDRRLEGSRRALYEPLPAATHERCDLRAGEYRAAALAQESEITPMKRVHVDVGGILLVGASRRRRFRPQQRREGQASSGRTRRTRSATSSFARKFSSADA